MPPHLPINPNTGQLVPPLEIGTQYLFKPIPKSERIWAEDMFEIDWMRREYQVRFASLKPAKPKPEGMEAPSLKPLTPKAKKGDTSPSPGLGL